MSSVISTLKGVFSGDTLVLVILFIVFFAYSMFLGRGRMLSFILAFYPASFLYINFPFVNKFLILHGDKMLALNKIVIFLLFLTPLTIIINRFIFQASDYVGSSKIFRTVGLSLCGVILVLVFAYAIAGMDALHDFSPKIDMLFSSMDRIFYWNLGIMALLAFL